MVAEFIEVVRQAAGSDHQHISPAQRRERLAETQMMIGPEVGSIETSTTGTSASGYISVSGIQAPWS